MAAGGDACSAWWPCYWASGAAFRHGRPSRFRCEPDRSRSYSSPISRWCDTCGSATTRCCAASPRQCETASGVPCRARCGSSISIASRIGSRSCSMSAAGSRRSISCGVARSWGRRKAPLNTCSRARRSPTSSGTASASACSTGRRPPGDRGGWRRPTARRSWDGFPNGSPHTSRPRIFALWPTNSPPAVGPGWRSRGTCSRWKTSATGPTLPSRPTAPRSPCPIPLRSPRVRRCGRKSRSHSTAICPHHRHRRSPPATLPSFLKSAVKPVAFPASACRWPTVPKIYPPMTSSG